MGYISICIAKQKVSLCRRKFSHQGTPTSALILKQLLRRYCEKMEDLKLFLGGRVLSWLFSRFKETRPESVQCISYYTHTYRTPISNDHTLPHRCMIQRRPSNGAGAPFPTSTISSRISSFSVRLYVRIVSPKSEMS